MRQPVTHFKRAGLFFLGLLFLVVLVGHGEASARGPAEKGLSSGDRVLSHQGFPSPFIPQILTPTLSRNIIPEGSDDLFCHHAYSGPLPSWECHHPQTHPSLSPLSPTGALEESLDSPQAPAREYRFVPLVHFATSRFLISPDRPPRHTLPL